MIYNLADLDMDILEITIKDKDKPALLAPTIGKMSFANIRETRTSGELQLSLQCRVCEEPVTDKYERTVFTVRPSSSKEIAQLVLLENLLNDSIVMKKNLGFETELQFNETYPVHHGLLFNNTIRLKLVVDKKTSQYAFLTNNDTLTPADYSCLKNNTPLTVTLTMGYYFTKNDNGESKYGSFSKIKVLDFDGLSQSSSIKKKRGT